MMRDRKIPVAVHLTDEEYRYFKLAYANHNSSMGLKERQHYYCSNQEKQDKELFRGILPKWRLVALYT